MKFRRLGEDKIQIIISSQDLEKRDVNKWDLMPTSPKAQDFFQEVLEEAYEECGFEVGPNTQLMVEAYPMTAESLVITVTKVKNKKHESLKNLISAKLEEDDDDEIILDDDDDEEELKELASSDIVYRFHNFEDVVDLAKVLYDKYEYKCNMYKQGKEYYLSFLSPEKIPTNIFGILGEYGDIRHIAEAYLNEHAELVIEKETIDVLASL